MKKIHLYYHPIMGEMKYRKVCFFYVVYWNSDNRSNRPDGLYWIPIKLPIIYDAPEFNTDIYKGILLYQFISSKFNADEEPVMLRIHPVSLSDHRFDSITDLLENFPEFDDGNMNGYVEITKDLKMTRRMRKHSGYELIQYCNQDTFQILTNIVYEYNICGNIRKLLRHKENDRTRATIPAPSTASVQLTRYKMIKDDAEYRVASYKRDYYKGVEYPDEPIEFAEFMKSAFK